MPSRPKRPDFFIVGAPKSGTTALSEYLREHRNVFVSWPKEPFFFCDDLSGLRRPESMEAYLRLFRRAPQHARAIGEASTLYLWSKTAPLRIRDFAPAARIIAMLRNPIDLCQAFYDELRRGQVEDSPDFEQAWRLQSERQAGRRLPSGCPEPALLQYREIALLGAQVKRLLEIFPKDQVLLLPFDDLVRDARGVYCHVLAFLGVEDDGRSSFPILYERSEQRFSWLARFTQQPPPMLSGPAAALRNWLRLERFSFLGPLRAINAVQRPRQPLSRTFRAELVAEFREDVQVLSQLLDRDLSHWLNDPPPP